MITGLSQSNLPKLNSFGVSTGLDDINTLYTLAQTQGGAIAENANEIMQPQSGILSTIGKGFKGVFNGFIEAISVPGQVVAGALSPKYSIAQAIEKNVAVSDVLFGKSKVGDTMAIGSLRLATDILTDPLSFISFGSTGAVKSVAKNSVRDTIATKLVKDMEGSIMPSVVSKIDQEIASGALDVANKDKRIEQLINESIAPKVDEELKKIADDYGLDINKEVWDLNINDEGEKYLANYQTFLREGREQNFLNNEADRLVKQSRGTLSKEVAIERVKEDLANKSLKFVTEFSGKKDYGTYKLLREVEGDYKTVDLLDTRLDAVTANKTLENLLGHNPQLWETLIDKGGMKYMGRSILEAQQIRKVLNHTPGWNYLDSMTAPLRSAIYNGYKRYLSGDIALSKTGRNIDTLGTEKKASEAMSYYRSRLANELQTDAVEKIHLQNALKLDDNSWANIQAAFQYRKRPVDPKLGALWDAKMYNKFNEELLSKEEIAAFTYGRTQLEKIYDKAIASGQSIANRENYFPNVLNIEQQIVAPKFTSSMKNPNNTHGKFAKWSTFQPINKMGKEFGDEIYTTPELLEVQPFYAKEEIKAVTENFEYEASKIGKKVEDINNEMIDIQADIQEKVLNIGRENFLKLIGGSVPERNVDNISAALKLFEEEFPLVNLEKMKKDRLAELSTKSSEIGEVLKTSPAKLKQVLEDAVAKTNSIPQNTSDFTKALNEVIGAKSLEEGILKTDIVSIDKALSEYADETVSSAELNQLRKTIKKAHKDYSEFLVRNQINKDDFTEFVNKLSNHAQENPQGVKRLLDGIIGREQKLSNLLDSLAVKKNEYINNLAGLQLLPDASLWKNRKGDLFKRYSGVAAEANKNGAHLETNGLISLMHASQSTIKSTIASDFIQDIAQTAGRVASEAPDGWRPIESTYLKEVNPNITTYLTGKTNEPILFHPDVAMAIENMSKAVITDETVHEALKHLDDVTNMFKATVTSLFPSFHAMNAMSNVWNNYIDIGRASLNPVNHVRAAKIINVQRKLNSLLDKANAGNEKALTDYIKESMNTAFTDNSGYNWTYAEIIDVAKKYDIAFGSQYLGVSDINTRGSLDTLMDIKDKFFKDEVSKFKKAAKTGAYGAKKVLDVAMEVGQTIEDQARMLNFIENLNKTGDVGQAANRTKMFLFDYSNLSQFERNLVRRALPFYTWTKKNIELQVKTMIHNPGLVSRQVKVMESLSNILSGASISEEEYNNLPEWMQGQFIVVTDKNGNKVRVLRNFRTPLESAFAAASPKEIANMVNPLFKFPMELVTGYDTFRGGMIDPHTNAELLKGAPKEVQQFFGLTSYTYKKKDGTTGTTYVVLNPRLYHAWLNLPVGGRVFNQMLKTSVARQDGNLSSPEYLIPTLIGLRYEEIDFDQLSNNKIREKRNQLQDLLETTGVTYNLNKPIQSNNTIDSGE